jgi:hypothetical protein
MIRAGDTAAEMRGAEKAAPRETELPEGSHRFAAYERISSTAR